MSRIALFPGTFDPFTIGHQSIVDRGLTLVDQIIIAIGLNEGKQTHYTIDQRLTAIATLYQSNSRVKVQAYDTLTVDHAQKAGAQFILRGIRTVHDFEYERNMADINRILSGIETLILFTEPAHAHISSGIVRDLLRHGKDISAFLPQKK